MIDLNSQVTNIISMILYGIFILIAIAILLIVGFALYKFVMWVLYAASSDGKKKEKKSMPLVIKKMIEDEIEYAKDLKEIKEVVE